MKLQPLTEENIDNILSHHHNQFGNDMNYSLDKMFQSMNNSDYFDVAVKVSALNQLYSTAIQYIEPVVAKIVEVIDDDIMDCTEDEAIALVDKIATVTWTSPSSGKEHTRCNLSFASKYIHFLTNKYTMIYDSYVWIVMNGYLCQAGEEYTFNNPKDFKSFMKTFNHFKETFGLTMSNYKIDKYLWQYGKELLLDIIEEENLTKAKSTLKKMIKEG